MKCPACNRDGEVILIGRPIGPIDPNDLTHTKLDPKRAAAWLRAWPKGKGCLHADETDRIAAYRELSREKKK